VDNYPVSYYGESTSRLDEKGRITVPRKMRDTMDVLGHAIWYMTRGFDQCIFLFHRDEWNRIRAQMSRRPAMNAQALDVRRLFFSGVAEVRPDNQGRMALPEHLREHAGIDREVVVIGVDQHIELWDKETWRAYTHAKMAEYKDMATDLFMGSETAEMEKGGPDNES
jgi:MraZ protein